MMTQQITQYQNNQITSPVISIKLFKLQKPKINNNPITQSNQNKPLTNNNLIQKGIQDKQREQQRQKQQKQKQKERQENEKRIQQLRLQNERKKKREEQERLIKQKKAEEQKKQQQQKMKAQQQERQRKQKQEQKKRQQEAQRLAQQLRSKQQNLRKQKQNQAQLKRNKLQRYKDAKSQIFLDLIVDYANSIKEQGQINCAINSVGDIKKVTKDLLIWTDSFIQKIDVNNPKQLNTFCVKLWNVIVNELIMKAKKDGIQIIPPTRLDAEIFKNCINTYILMINVLRVKKHEKIWLYMVGKTLGLLDFIYKRKENIIQYKNLDLVSKNYIKKFGQNFQNIYFSRLDQISYLLFGLLLMNPFDCFIQIATRTDNLPHDVRHMIDKLNKPWDYSIFWVLIQQVRSLPFRYFRPVCYNNILSILTIHMVEARTSGTKPQFLQLYKSMTSEALTFSKTLNTDPEIKTIMGWQVDGYIDGEDFIDMLHPIKTMGMEKKKLLENENIKEVQKKGAILYYFKTTQPAST